MEDAHFFGPGEVRQNVSKNMIILFRGQKMLSYDEANSSVLGVFCFKSLAESASVILPDRLLYKFLPHGKIFKKIWITVQYSDVSDIALSAESGYDYVTVISKNQTILKLEIDTNKEEARRFSEFLKGCLRRYQGDSADVSAPVTGIIKCKACGAMLHADPNGFIKCGYCDTVYSE